MSNSSNASSSQNTLEMPILPMRDIVVFPHMTAPFFIGRALSIAALEKALASDRKIFVIAQEDPLVEIPRDKDLFEIGTIGQVLQIMRLHNGTIKALFEAHQRGRLVEARMGEPYYTGVVEPIEEIDEETPEMVALSKNVRSELKRYLKDVKKHTEGIEKLSIESDPTHRLADRIAPLLNMDLQRKQKLLETISPQQRLERGYERMIEEAEFKKVEKKLKERVQGQIGRTQKEYYLNAVSYTHLTLPKKSSTSITTVWKKLKRGALNIWQWPSKLEKSGGQSSV